MTTANQILAHFDSIAADVGEIFIDDLVDHFVSQGNPEPTQEDKKELLALNQGNTIFG
jgi:hypothetical protein